VKKLSIEVIRASALLKEPTSAKDVLNILSLAGSLEERLLGYAWSALAHRTLMSLLPSFDGLKTYNDRRRAVERVLRDRDLFNQVSGEEIEGLVDLGSRLLEARAGARKSSWADLHYTTRREILVRQNHRCVVCGVVLELGESGKENSPELDHILPFVMRGNVESNTRVICKRCNLAKHDHLTYLTLGRLAVGDTIRGEEINMNSLLYWAIEIASSACQRSGCSNTSFTHRLHMIKRASLIPFNIDNVAIYCDSCSAAQTRFPI
jgi:hypothetical protein